MNYPKRLIEVDLPIKRISAHASREKSIRHGHISTMHIWWARRPLGACRAVLCASLWIDPADKNCPKIFLEKTANALEKFASRVISERQVSENISPECWKTWNNVAKKRFDIENPKDVLRIRLALLDFIADFANWDNAVSPAFYETSRNITQAAYESSGGSNDTHPLVIDPFAGGASIPLEALRIGANVFASDLNPVAVLLNKSVVEDMPKYGKKLAETVKELGVKIQRETAHVLLEYYPKDKNGSIPIAYLWARTVRCEGPGCGANVPLLRSLWLSKKGNNLAALKLVTSKKNKEIKILVITKPKKQDVEEGTIRRSSCTCPVCGYTTLAENVRNQFVSRNGGANDSVLVAVVLHDPRIGGIKFRSADENDYLGFEKASRKLAKLLKIDSDIIPTEALPYLRSIFNVNLLGIDNWSKLFNNRQLLSLVTLIEKTNEVQKELKGNNDFNRAVVTCLAFAVDRCADYWSSLAVWANDFVAHTFGRQALGIVWDYAEVSGFAGGSGNYDGAIDWICRFLERESIPFVSSGQVEKMSAGKNSLPDKSVQAVFTDPPYYDAVPYADLSDFFYVWLKRTVGKNYYAYLFSEELSPKNEEIVQLAERNPKYAYKTKEYFEQSMKEAMKECLRVLIPDGICVVVFAHKSTAGWEAQLNAMIDAGWCITGSWPIDTERPGRLRANNSAALASSVHLICRPRNRVIESENNIGDWRDVLAELPIRIHNWMPRLAEEGIVGADAIFACIGPALEIFSKYDRVEKANGEIVALGQYLENVWGAVAREALTMIFDGADTSGFEEDARLTAMWLWTLNTQSGNDNSGDEQSDEEVEESVITTGFSLEYDTARKIAQGIGAHLEELNSVVEIKGDKAKLLSIEERTSILFEGANKFEEKRKKKISQQSLFVDKVDHLLNEELHLNKEIKAGTVLDLIHQAMILFGAGRTAALKRFLVEDGAGKDQRFWKLAQALNALYPEGTNERRWVEGVQTHKKSLGL